MSNSIKHYNEVSNPVKPENIEAVTTRCRNLLIKGVTLNRKTLDDMEITVKNASLHSVISILRNDQLIPIESKRTTDETCNYFMKPEEIERYNNPELRTHQRNEMKILVETKRQKKILVGFMKFLHQLQEIPQMWQYLDYLALGLTAIAETANALLEKRNGR